MISLFKKRILLTAFALTVISTLFAQSDTEKKIKDQNVVPGSITRAGTKIEGYIIKMGKDRITSSTNQNLYDAPWTFQKEIRFIEKSKFESLPKVKWKDYEGVDASDIEGYSYNNDSLKFDSQKYANLNNPGLGMVPKMVFLRRVAKHSKISVYVHYTIPKANGPEESQLSNFKESTKPYLVYYKAGDDNAKGVGLLNVEKQLGECPKVVERYKKGEYKSQGFERSEYGNYLANASDQDISKLYAIAEFNRGHCD